MVSPDGGSKAKAIGRASIASFWEDASTVVQRDYDVISVEDLEPLMGKSPRELMSSMCPHLSTLCFFFLKTAIYIFLQMLGESMYISGKYLDYDGKLAKAQSKTTSLSAENELLKSQISALADKAKKDKDRWKTLEKSIDTEKAFSKLKEKQIDETLLKVKASSEAVEKFKVSDEYSDKLCDYYVEGFELFRKYLARHHPSLDFSKLDMEAVEKEILADRQSVEGVGEGGDVVAPDEAASVDPSSSSLP